MAIEVKFTCNICNQIYIRTDGKNKIPEGWGAVRPTLRVNMPSWSQEWSSEQKKEWVRLSNSRDELKRKLWENEYHLCHICLDTAQNKILKIEETK